ncbi:MAG: glycerol-3-phosphate 1-O-acyltransferase PlsY [Gemmatimonadota bacterium]
MIGGLLLLAYFLGATPTSHLVGRAMYGVDLREHGSGNLGATNVFRVLGWKAALPVATVDVGKGWLPTALFPRWDQAAGAEWALAYGAAAIVGHVFSVFVRFRGGKGVATSAGVFLALAPWATLAGLGAWVATVAATRIVSLGSLMAAVTLPVAVYLTGEPRPVLGLAAGLALFVILAHRSNIRRLLRGEENRFGRKGTTP